MGALVGMSMLNLDANKGFLAARRESVCPKLSGTRIRHKAIPIINPLVKNPNWPSTISHHKRGKSNLSI